MKAPYILIGKFFLTTLALTNCTGSIDKTLWDKLNAWIGKHPDTLVEAWGAPHSSYITSKGRKVLSFEKEILATSSFYDYYRPQIYASSSSCKINFFTNEKQDSINDVSYIGDAHTCLELCLSPRKAKH